MRISTFRHQRPVIPKIFIRRLIVTRAAHSDDKSLFIFGLGYSGLAAANYFQRRNWHVAGTCRTEEKTEVLKARGFEAYTFHTDGYEQLSRNALNALYKATHIISTVPPDGDADPVLMAHARDMISLAGKNLQWIGYISSTSVYGDHGSEWVDEESELLAAHGKGLSRILAEGNWIAMCYEYDVPVHVFRCGGIYGPRRSALDTLKKEGPPSASQERRAKQKLTARCHVYDICQVLEASIEKPRAGGVYNVVDNEPAPRGEVIAYAERLLNGRMAAEIHEMGNFEKRPIGLESMASSLDMDTVSSSSSSSGGSSSSDSQDAVEPVKTRVEEREEKAPPTANGEKRVKNSLIKEELGVRLMFPTYREGLTAICDGDMRPFE